MDFEWLIVPGLVLLFLLLFAVACYRPKSKFFGPFEERTGYVEPTEALPANIQKHFTPFGGRSYDGP